MVELKIYEKLERYCASVERCNSQVTQKLYSLKVNKDDFDEYLDKLKKENYLNEERFVKAFVEAYTRKKWGKVKIKNTLSIKRLPRNLIDKYIADIIDDDYQEHLTKLIQKKWLSLRKGTRQEKMNKLKRFLLGKGYEMGKIGAAIKGENLVG